MKQRAKLLGYYNYTVILTYVGMLFGFTGIRCAIAGYYFHSVLCLMLAGTCDMFDGAIAATRERTHQEKCFGIQIDSLSDLICFGVLPGVLICCMNGGRLFAYLISAFYVLCALIRLAYFNVDEQDRQQKETGCREFYSGLPVTSSALLIPLAYEICTLLSVSARYIAAALLAAMAVAFVLPFRLKKPHKAGKIGLVLFGGAAFALLILVGVQGV